RRVAEFRCECVRQRRNPCAKITQRTSFASARAALLDDAANDAAVFLFQPMQARKCANEAQLFRVARPYSRHEGTSEIGEQIGAEFPPNKFRNGFVAIRRSGAPKRLGEDAQFG